MKSTSIPAVRVEPELREELELVLRDGESLSSFVEASVRESIRRRQDQAAFVKRGMTSLSSARRTGAYLSATAVVGKLEARLAEAKAKIGSPRRKATAGR
jgi:hypothetical protein